LTTGRVLMGTWPVASLHQRSAAKSIIGMTATCATSSTEEIHVAR
jgi:hypothetical protein